MARIYRMQKVAGAEELLEALSPVTGKLWSQRVRDNAADQWVFRGQANEANGTIWDLTPSACRQGVFDKFGVAGPTSAQEARQAEQEVVNAFLKVVDRSGIELPHDSPQLRYPRPTAPPNPTMFPLEEQVATFALAQHYEVPTRLLDWTWNPLIAAYFAAEIVAKRQAAAKQITSVITQNRPLMIT